MFKLMDNNKLIEYAMSMYMPFFKIRYFDPAEIRFSVYASTHLTDVGIYLIQMTNKFIEEASAR